MVSFISILLITIFSACGNAPKEYFIKGSYAAGAGKTIVIEKLTPEKQELLDSAQISKTGEFYLIKKPTETGRNYYRLRLSTNTGQMTNPAGMVFLITGPDEKITFTSTGTELSDNYKVEGSAESQTLNELSQKLKSTNKLNDSLNTEFQKISDANVRAQKAIEFQQIANQRIAERNEYIKNVINNNPNSLVSLEAVGQLDPSEFYELHKKVADNLGVAYPNNGFVQNYVRMITSKAGVSIGAPAPEIDLPGPDGKNVKLSSLRGKYVLIDFWASWCRPCRMENPNLVKAYSKYHSKGLEIFGVSLDKEKAPWEAAIQADNLTWIHVSDLQYWSSAAARLYNVSSIPKSFLVDKEGKIIATDLRGELLEQKLAQLMP